MGNYEEIMEEEIRENINDLTFAGSNRKKYKDENVEGMAQLYERSIVRSAFRLVNALNEYKEIKKGK